MASTTIGRLNFMVSADANGVRTGLLVGEQALSGFAGRITSVYQSVIAQLQLNPLTQFLGWGVRLAAEGQQAETGFRVFLKSAEKAKDLMGDIRQFALESPLGTDALQQSAQTLLGYGAAGDTVMPILRQLGDVSQGSSQKLQLLTLATAQVISKGRLMGGELRQLTESGFNPLKVIFDQTGIGMLELTKRMEAGEISFEMFLETLRLTTSEGGLHYNLLNEQAENLAPKWNALNESIGELSREIGESLAPSLGKLLATGKEVLEWVNGFDSATVRSTVSLTAMTVAFGAAITIIPKIVAGYRAIATAQRAVAIANAFALATTPQGIVVLGLAATAAFAAGVAMDKFFDSMDAKGAKAATAASEVQAEVSSMFDALKGEGSAGESLDSLKERLRGIKEETADAKRHFQEMIRAVESRRGNTFTSAADRYTTSGQQAIFTGALERVIQEELAKLRSEQATSLRRLEEQEKKIERAIKEKAGTKEVRF